MLLDSSFIFIFITSISARLQAPKYTCMCVYGLLPLPAVSMLPFPSSPFSDSLSFALCKSLSWLTYARSIQRVLISQIHNRASINGPVGVSSRKKKFKKKLSLVLRAIVYSFHFMKIELETLGC